MDITNHKPGTFCWADVLTHHQADAKTFYGKLFGWTTRDMPMGPGLAYSIQQVRGKDAAAISPNTQEPPNTPARWNCYVAVANVEESTARAKKLGANVVMPVMDVMEQGLMSMVADPMGATVALWQAKKHAGFGAVFENSACCWNELMTTDVDKATRFYSELFGWKCEAKDMGKTKYWMWTHQGDQVAGMIKIDPQWGPVPTAWMPYFTVANADKTVDLAKQLKGKALMPMEEVKEMGRFCAVADPHGAAFGIMQFAAK